MAAFCIMVFFMCDFTFSQIIDKEELREITKNAKNTKEIRKILRDRCTDKINDKDPESMRDLPACLRSLKLNISRANRMLYRPRIYKGSQKLVKSICEQDRSRCVK